MISETIDISSKDRQSNIELFRIVVMFFITAGHLVCNTGLNFELHSSIDSVRNVYFWLLGMWGKIGVNCFVLITGWFMCTSKITLKKFLKLLLQIYFYKITLNILLCCIGYSHITIRSLFWILSPIGNVNTNDFTSCYLLFFLCIPFLNILIKNMNKKQHLLLCVGSVMILSLWHQFYWVEVDFSYLMWFPVLYLISSYIRLYGIENKCVSILFSGGGKMMFVWVLLSMGSVLLMLYILPHYHKNLQVYYFVADGNALLALPTSISLFLFFKDLNLKYNAVINKIASCTFGVLLFHTTGLMKWMLFDVCCKAKDIYASNHYILCSFGAVLFVYILGTLFDLLRQYLAEKPLFNYLMKKQIL